MNIPVLGYELMSATGLIALLGIIMVVAYFWKPLNKLPGINAIPNQWMVIIGIGLLLGAPMIAGFAATDADTGTQVDTTDCYNTTDVELTAFDADTGSLLGSENVKVYSTGYSDSAYVDEDGEATILRSVSLSSGEKTLSGWDTEQYPEGVFVVDDSTYYQTIAKEDLRVERATDDNTKGVTIRATDMGTIDTSKTSGSDLATGNHDVTVFYGNSESDSEIRHPVVKIDNTTDITVDSVDSGGELVEVDDTKYLVFDQTVIEGGDYATLTMTIDISSDGSQGMGITYDDLWQQFGSDSIPSDGDIQSVSSSSQTLTFH